MKITNKILNVKAIYLNYKRTHKMIVKNFIIYRQNNKIYTNTQNTSNQSFEFINGINQRLILFQNNLRITEISSTAKRPLSP